MKSSWLAGSLFSLLLLWNISSFAQSTLSNSQIEQTKIDLQNLHSQWRQSHPQDPNTSLAFRSYLLSRRDTNSAGEYGQFQYNNFTNALYQPVYVLLSGAWVMGTEDRNNQMGLWVDINGAAAPGFRGIGLDFDQKEMILDSQGQVIQVLD
jgi:hypothetical protein